MYANYTQDSRFQIYANPTQMSGRVKAILMLLALRLIPFLRALSYLVLSSLAHTVPSCLVLSSTKNRE